MISQVSLMIYDYSAGYLIILSLYGAMIQSYGHNKFLILYFLTLPWIKYQDVAHDFKLQLHDMVGISYNFN